MTLIVGKLTAQFPIWFSKIDGDHMAKCKDDLLSYFCESLVAKVKLRQFWFLNDIVTVLVKT